MVTASGETSLSFVGELIQNGVTVRTSENSHKLSLRHCVKGTGCVCSECAMAEVKNYATEWELMRPWTPVHASKRWVDDRCQRDYWTTFKRHGAFFFFSTWIKMKLCACDFSTDKAATASEAAMSWTNFPFCIKMMAIFFSTSTDWRYKLNTFLTNIEQHTHAHAQTEYKENQSVFRE